MYIDGGSALLDATSRQNHVVFARRGCGKSLLLHSSSKTLATGDKSIYLNCEDFKHHSFPNVIIEILDALFIELQKNLTGWFGRKKKSKEIIGQIRAELDDLRHKEDITEQAIKETLALSRSSEESAKVAAKAAGVGSFSLGSSADEARRQETEKVFSIRSEKLRDLNQWLPRLKRHIADFFELSTGVQSIILQVDDFYHLKKADQPFLVDYIHRLCKDLPIYFKIATLKHASILYVDRGGQPIGAQERHDYQPINIDYTLSDFNRTEIQNKRILEEFGVLADMQKSEISALFKGEGFSRLVMAGGGVPRDTLSLFLEALSSVQQHGDGRIGKDDVRVLSKTNFERRIEELKYDAQTDDHEPLIKGIYVLRQFCLDRKTNCFLVSERVIQQNDRIRSLIYRLLDYRIIHNAGTALTHKSQEGAFQAFAIDIGCYAHLRKLQGKMAEIDLSLVEAKEKLRSAPVLDISAFEGQWEEAPENAEELLIVDES